MGILEMYRSGDFSKLEPYRGKLAALDVPFLALWGEDDPFAPVAGAYRFQKEIPGAEVVAVEGARALRLRRRARALRARGRRFSRRVGRLARGGAGGAQALQPSFDFWIEAAKLGWLTGNPSIAVVYIGTRFLVPHFRTLTLRSVMCTG